LIEAEQKTEEKKEIILEHPPPSKPSSLVDKVVQSVWYSRPVSDEDDISDETHDQKITDDKGEQKIIVPDIDTSLSEDTETSEQEKAGPIPTWIHDQVYGDKVSYTITE
jgi:hypothetical protein